VILQRSLSGSLGIAASSIVIKSIYRGGVDILGGKGGRRLANNSQLPVLRQLSSQSGRLNLQVDYEVQAPQQVSDASAATTLPNAALLQNKAKDSNVFAKEIQKEAERYGYNNLQVQVREVIIEQATTTTTTSPSESTAETATMMVTSTTTRDIDKRDATIYGPLSFAMPATTLAMPVVIACWMIITHCFSS